MDSANGDPPSTGRVSPFGYLRIQACSAAPRSFSQPCHVLHRFLAPKHPPCTLGSLTTASSKQTDSQRTNSRPMRRSPAIRIPPRSCVPGLETGEHLGLQPQTREQHLIVKERSRPGDPRGVEPIRQEQLSYSSSTSRDSGTAELTQNLDSCVRTARSADPISPDPKTRTV